MIEFKQDGPLGRSRRGPRPAHVRLLGLGQTGIGALDHIMLHGQGEYDLWALDTDEQTLEASVVAEKKFLGGGITRGLGCGGEREMGERVAEAEAEQCRRAVEGCRYLVLTLGLGGGTGPALARQLLAEARKKGGKESARVLVVAAMPFGFESRRRLKQAAQALAELRGLADAVLVFASDRLAAAPGVGKNLRHGFHAMSRLIGESAETLAQLCGGRSLITLNFADVRSVFGRFTGAEVLENGWAGSGQVEAQDEETAFDELVNQVLDSPLLADGTAWEQADRALVSLTGGPELSVTQVQEALAELEKRLPAKIPISVGAHAHERCRGKLRLTLLLANTSRVPAETSAALLPEDSLPLEAAPEAAAAQLVREVPLGVPESRPPRPAKTGRHRKHVARQEELPLTAESRGRFEHSIQTIYKGEDLDIPTFRRRKLAVRV